MFRNLQSGAWLYRSLQSQHGPESQASSLEACHQKALCHDPKSVGPQLKTAVTFLLWILPQPQGETSQWSHILMANKSRLNLQNHWAHVDEN